MPIAIQSPEKWWVISKLLGVLKPIAKDEKGHLKSIPSNNENNFEIKGIHTVSNHILCYVNTEL